MATTINASTSSGLVETADTSGQLELQSNGTTQLTVSSTGAYGQLKSATAQASTSGTSIDFTSIPSWAKRITVMFSGVSTNGSNPLQIQLGSGSYTTSGYSATAFSYNSGTADNSTVGLILSQSGTSSDSYYGNVVITLLTSNGWTSSGVVKRNAINISAGGVSLSGTLDRLRIIGSTTGSPTDTFDAGSVNILYEG